MASSEMINILLSTNDNYMMPTMVLMESVLDTQTAPVSFYLLWSDLKECSRAALREFAEGRGSTITFLKIDGDAFADLPTKDYISRETYFRLLAADLLPKELDRILWLDSDMIVRGNLDGLYDMDFEGAAVIACPHGQAMREVMDINCRNIRIEHREQYFNAGMMLCNLARWRTMDIKGRITRILGEDLPMEFPGQDLTNLVFNGSVKCKDYIRYNCMIHSIADKDTYDRAKEEAVIVHFVGRAKPWVFYDLYFADEFDVYYGRTRYGEKALNRKSYFFMKKLYEMRERTRKD